MAIMTGLANQLLIAMPGCTDPDFKQSVIYVCEHHESGSVGLIINKPTEFHLDLIFNQLHITPSKLEQKNLPLMFGGPTQPERGFVMHNPTAKSWRSSLSLPMDVTITTSNDIIRDIAAGEGPENALVILGYSGWNNHQLEKEIQENLWLVCPYKPELLFDIPFDKRWTQAGLSLGIDMHQLTSDSGHA